MILFADPNIGIIFLSGEYIAEVLKGSRAPLYIMMIEEEFYALEV